MYPGTIFEYIDQSDITPFEVAQPIEPLFMCAITSDKGPENALVVKGTKFYTLYGKDLTMAFAKHGQPLIQAARIIDAGGKLYVKRVVDSTSKLANLAIIAKVTAVETQKVNDLDEPLYLTAGGVETTEPGTDPLNTPIMIVSSASVKYEAQGVVGKSTRAEIADVIKAELDIVGEEISGNMVYTYPLFVITDNGRGVSAKSFRLTPDYATSKNLDFMYHTIEVIENNEILDTVKFSMDKDVIYYGINKSLESVVNTTYSQIKASYIEEGVTPYVAKLASILDMSVAEVEAVDILFGKDRTGVAIDGFTLDATGINLQYVYGLSLIEGANGTSFGTHPIGTDAYETEMVKFFDGTFTDDIYDVDNIKIDAIVDANYPDAVKTAIENFVTFREDCFYFGDIGTGARTQEEIKNAASSRMKNKFCSQYHTFYDVIDPFSKKQITVTMCYTLAKLLVSHFINGRNRPVAGYLHDMVIPEAIEGTINFIPKITPTANQKDFLDDLRINYAGLYDNLLTIETEYTSQSKYSQFSFINNILAIQEVTKAIRSRCPKTRYSFISGNDLEKYKEDVQTVIDKYTGNFKTITLEYIGTPTTEANKMFYAALKVQFKDFVQTEYFKVYALA